MSLSLILGAVFLAAGLLLLFICLPKRDGRQPAFLKKEFFSMLTPVTILSLLVMGMGLLWSSL
ncbi:hypothetical protein [Salinarimonas soli]|uniref:Uncharacterized protein n=1 Tax=Salinarimonas soli TaxID=1638099 RepID=A0A5B2V711_9HYPH|nr:hypothetical protein [Salinarimonas soli]KAA2234754.1 hypothetical protein F0L46_23070 [Salinarimonas soli]